MRKFLLCLCLLVAGGWLSRAAETIPPTPSRYFNDYALAVKPETAERLNHEMAEFERSTSTQILAAIFPKMLSDSSLDDYAERVFRAWKVGTKGTNNGVLILVFIQDHKMRIQPGYGLEGALPDATCKDIVSDRMAPLFKQGDFDAGMTAGVEAVMQAVKGEYKGSGKTVADRQARPSGGGGGLSPIFIFLLIAGFFIFQGIFGRRGRGTMFTGAGPIFFGGGFGGGGGFGSGGGFGDSGGGGGGGGDSFSSGGGDSGGGGASGSW